MPEITYAPEVWPGDAAALRSEADLGCNHPDSGCGCESTEEADDGR